MFEVQTDSIRRLERRLQALSKRAVPFATRETVNRAAFAAMGEAREIVGKKMIERNKYTRQSIRVDKAKGQKIDRQMAVVGSIADYMAEQEFGATERKTGREGVAIATSYSSGQGRDTKPRTKLALRRNKMQNIQLQKKAVKKMKSKKQQAIAVIKASSQKGRRYAFLDFGRRKGIFEVTGSKKNTKINMLYDLSRQSVRIPPRPWLWPAVQDARRLVNGFYEKSLRRQIEKINGGRI